MYIICLFIYLFIYLTKSISGPLRYKIEAHFTNAVGGLDAEFSYDEIGLLQVSNKLNTYIFSLYFTLLCLMNDNP